MSFELGARRKRWDLTFMFIWHVQRAMLALIPRKQYEDTKSDFCLRPPYSDDMDFFRMIKFPQKRLLISGRKKAATKCIMKVQYAVTSG